MKIHTTLAAALAACAAMVLAACDPGADATVDRADAARDSSGSIAEKTVDTARASAETASESLRSAGVAVTNASITAAVKAELMKEPSLSAMSIDVDTSGDGRVTLSGSVRSEDARQRAEQLARATEGVTSVRNELEVRPA
ncbi:MAG TPA: BON domain-containing protein [Zeimonas sp.]